MSMRITNSMVRRHYETNLNGSLGGLEQSRQQVETGRRFADSYEDPAAAAKASILETKYMRNADYINAVKDTQKWQDSQENILTQINDIAKEIEQRYSVEALNDTNATSRETYAQTFRELQESMVNILNTTYGDSYLMAGTDGGDPPFIIEDSGTITFRGYDVNDPANAAIMEEFMNDASYVDLGFGLSFDATGEVIAATAFDAGYPGIKAIGYGQDADGTSQNMLVLLGQMADALEAPTLDREKYEELWTAFGEGADQVRDGLVEMGTRTTLLDSTLTKLEAEELSLTEQFDNTVNIDPAKAILNMSYSQYMYDIALKVGTNLLTPSLLDFIQ